MSRDDYPFSTHEIAEQQLRALGNPSLVIAFDRTVEIKDEEARRNHLKESLNNMKRGLAQMNGAAQ